VPKCPTCKQKVTSEAVECSVCGSWLGVEDDGGTGSQPVLVMAVVPAYESRSELPTSPSRIAAVEVTTPVMSGLHDIIEIEDEDGDTDDDDDTDTDDLFGFDGGRTPIPAVRELLAPPTEQARTRDEWVNLAERYVGAERLTDALDAYERAFQKGGMDPQVLERMVELSERTGDALRLSRSLATLAHIEADPTRRADFLIRAARVTRDQRHELAKAAAGLKAALESDPDRLDAFQELSALHSECADWETLVADYQFMIEKHASRAEPNRPLLSKLWRKLGTLLADPLQRFEEAALAVQTATDLAPDDVKNLATLLDIYKLAPGHQRDAIRTLSRLIEAETDPSQQVGDLKALAKLYLEVSDHDAAFCCLRVLCFLGEATEQEQAFVEKLRRRVVKIPEVVFTADMWTQAILPKGYPQSVASIMGLLAPAVAYKFGHDLEFHGVSNKDRIDPEEPLLFNTLMKRVSKIFGVDGGLDVYLKDGVEGLGLINGLLDPPALIVDRSMLSGRGAAELAFAVARLLALQKQDFYLAGISPLNNLEVFVMGATKFVLPEAPIPASKDIEWITKSIRTRLDDDRRDRLQKGLHALIEAGTVLELERYLLTVDMAANRLAFIIADDLEAAADAIARDQEANALSSADKRLDQLLSYAISPPYLRLRRDLGITAA